MTRAILAATAALALSGAGQAMAFQSPEAATIAEKQVSDGTTADERANTGRLNAEQASRAKAENTAYEQQVLAVQQKVAHDHQVHSDATAAYEAEKTRIAAAWADARRKWEADVAACKAGDKKRCAQPAAPAR